MLKVLAVLWKKNSCLLLLTIGRETEAQQKKEEATWGYPGRRKLCSTRVKLYILLIQHSRHSASQLLLLSFPNPSQGQGGSQLCPIILQFSWLSSSLERFGVALCTAVHIFPQMLGHASFHCTKLNTSSDREPPTTSGHLPPPPGQEKVVSLTELNSGSGGLRRRIKRLESGRCLSLTSV